jgi:hypothetical protein
MHNSTVILHYMIDYTPIQNCTQVYSIVKQTEII